MKARHRQPARYGLFVFTAIWLLVLLPLSAVAAPYAALVMDARSGKVLHAENADTQLHPASLTKMMTLYIAFQAVENGEIGLDTLVTVSRNAAAEPPSKLGLREGQRIKLRYLMRAAAVKSANDAATAIGEAISGSEAAFARRMNRTAKAMGMTRTHFKNAHGLTEVGHMSTARDMTILGRHVIYDFPQYYNLFARKTADAGIKRVAHTNRRFLSDYKGADGIKTGYTRAAGFNLTASAERGGERIIATVFGGRSTATRNARVAELLDIGFRKAPSRVALQKPQPVSAAVATGAAGKTIRMNTAVAKSLRPVARPIPEPVAPPVALALKDDIREALLEAHETAAATAAPARTVQDVPAVKPAPRPAGLALAAARSPAPRPAPEPEPEVVTRISTSGGAHWGINVGRYPSRFAAERVLLKTALAEMTTLDGSLRKVIQKPTGFDANFMGLTRERADLACRRLQARNVSCFMIGPG